MNNQHPRETWRHGSSATGKAKPESRTGRAFAVGLIVLALAGVVVAFLTFLTSPPEPVVLAVGVTEYEDARWPVNPWAFQQSERLDELFPDAARTSQSQNKTGLLRQLRLLADEDDSERPIIAHLCACGISYRGEPYLLPADAQPHSPGGWLTMADLVEPLEPLENPRVLILDLEPAVSPRFGAFRDDLFERVMARLEKLREEGRLSYPVSVRVGRDVHARILGTRTHGLLLAAGLRGYADGWNRDGDKDDSVSVAEWLGFAAGNLTAWEARSGGADTDVAVSGVEADFPVVPLRREPPAVEVPEAPGGMPEWLLAAWKEHDGWIAAGDHVRVPGAFRRLESACLRAESLWLGGVDVDAVRENLQDNEIAGLRRRRAGSSVPSLRPWSLAEWARSQNADLTEAENLLRPVMPLFRTVKVEPAGGDQPAPVPAKFGEVLKGFGRSEEQSPPEMAALLVFRRNAEGKEPGVEEFLSLASALAQIPDVPPQAETLAVRFVAGLPRKRLERNWKPDSRTAFFRCVEASERAAAFELRCLPWVIDELKRVDEARREATRLLLIGGDTDKDRAAGMFRDCVDRYEEIRELTDPLGSAFGELDEAQLLLAATVEFAPPGEDRKAGFDEEWSALAEKCTRLRGRLSASTAEPSDLRKAVSEVAFRRGRLVETAGLPKEADARELEQWRQWPRWSADQRAVLVTRLTDAAHGEVTKAAGEFPVAFGVPETKKAARGDADEGVWRVRRMAELLRLTGDPEAVRFEGVIPRLHEGDEGAWGEAADLVRGRYGKALGERSPAERLAWAAHPFESPGEDTTPAWLREQQRRYEVFLRDRYAADAAAITGAANDAERTGDSDRLPKEVAGDYAARLRGLIRRE